MAIADKALQLTASGQYRRVADSGQLDVGQTISSSTGSLTITAVGSEVIIASGKALTVNDVLNADGGIGRSTSGTLAIGNDADVTQIDIGTATGSGPVNLGTGASFTTVTIGQLGQTQALAGNATVAGTLVATGEIAANGGLGRSTSGTLAIGTDAQTTALTIGSASVLTTMPGSLTVQGNLIVEGTTFSVESENVLVDDNHLYLNNNYTTAVAQTGGLVVNYLPTAKTDTVAGAYVPGVAATSNPQVTTTGVVSDSGTATSGGASTLTDTSKTWTVNQFAGFRVKITAGTGSGQSREIASNTVDTLTTATAWGTAPDNTSVYSIVRVFVVGELVQISGSTNNNGLYEVLSHIDEVLRIRGIGVTATVEDFTQNQLIAGSSDGATIARVNVSVIRAGTDGIWETAAGSATPLSFTDIGTGTLSGSGTAGRVAVWNGSSSLTSDAELTYDSGTNVLTLGTSRHEDGSAATPSVSFTADSGDGLFHATDTVAVALAGSEVARFTLAGGNGALLVGTTTALSKVTVDDNSGQRSVAISMYAHAAAGTAAQETTAGGQFAGIRSRGTIGSPTAVGANDGLANILGIGRTSAGGLNYGGQITIAAEESYTASASGGRIAFYTTAVGADGVATIGTSERMRITPTGNLLIGTTTDSARLTVSGGITQTSGAVSLTANAASSFATTSGDLTLDAQAASLILDGGEAAADAVRIVASNAAGGIDVDAGSAGITIDTTGGVSIDATGASNLTSAAGLTLQGGAASTLTTTAGDLTVDAQAASLILDGGEAAADAVRIVASNAAGGIDVDAGSAGVAVDTTGGVSIDAGAASNLSTSAGLLTVSGAGGLDLNAATGQEVAIQINATDVFTATATALTVQAGVVLGTTGSGNINLPNNGSARFQVEGTAVGSTVTAVNLDTLTNGSNADALHTHSGGNASTTDVALTAGETLNAGDLVCLDDDAGNPRVFKADANGSGERQNPIGVAVAAAASAGDPVSVRVAGEISLADARFDSLPGVANVGQRVFMSTTAGNFTLTAPSTSGDVVQKVAIVSRGGTGNVRVIVQIGEGILL